MRNCYQFVSYSRLTNLLWTLLIVVLCNCSPKFGCPLEEYEALLKLKSSLLHYNNSSLSTWGRGRDCCLWERVSCNNSTQQVSKLMLSSLLEYDQLQDWRLNFSIFSSFHELQQLNLSYNQIAGSLSQIDMSELRKLEILDLGYNRLTGNIPLSFKNLSSLSVLHLEENLLNGTLNVEGLLGLHKLRLLNLGENHLIGGISIALGNLSSLNFLYLFQNNLTGSVPSQ
uniref:MDIS1-interacting receptor like kinase 2-like n=1 Tax=Elaeis guineensis var. tenera TaxID=51953 RepID=A0A8N4IBM0_ELAGV